jgi:inosine-uridine nucleoside N-ribohydrolase
MKENMKKERLLIDTDMGNDDIMAFAMLSESRFQIMGYALTDGVARTHAGASNLTGLLNYLGRPAPIAIGPKRQFQAQVDFPSIDIQRAEELTLVKDLNIKIPEEPQLQTFEKLTTEALSDPTTLFALGPLTNVAAIIENYPASAAKISRIVMMGGGINSGNVSPDNFAEYNIALDPPSADKVFKSGIPIIMVGIDATKTVPATSEFAQGVSSLIPGTKSGEVIRKIIINNAGDFNQFYDPLAAAILIDQSIATDTSTGNVSVSQEGLNIGQTFLNTSPSGTVKVILSAKADKFFDLMTDLITQKRKGGVN